MRECSTKLMTVDPANGNRAVLSNSVTGTGPAFSSLEGVAVDAADNILVVDAGLGAVFVVDPANGNRTILSDAVTGTGSRRMTTLRRRCNDYPPVAGMLDRVDECIAAGNVKESGWEFRGNYQKCQGAY